MTEVTGLLDVLLLAAPVSHPASQMSLHVVSTPPLGITYLAAVLRQHGFRVGCVDFLGPGTTVAHLKAVLDAERPRLVGISATTQGMNNAARLARYCKQQDPGVIVVLGGPHVTFEDASTLRDCPAADVVVRGEGEATLLELAAHYLLGWSQLADIMGITYRRDEKVIRTRRRSLIKNLDALPFPARDLLPSNGYTSPYCVATSRGCPGRCIFCAAAAISGGKYRMRTWQNVVAELVYLKSVMSSPSSLLFADDTLTADPGRTARLCRAMIELKLGFRWQAESRVDVVTEELLSLMAEAGCVGIQFGVESGSPRTLSTLRKNIKLEDVVRAVRIATALGLEVKCSFIAGLPGETAEDIGQTADFAESLQTEYGIDVGVSIATPLPGTYMYKHREQLQMEIESADWADFHFLNPVFSTPQLSVQEARNLHYDTMTRLINSLPEATRRKEQARAERMLSRAGHVAHDDNSPS